MAVWYEGNRNTPGNRREKDGITYYIRGVSEVDGKRYERYAVQTHFIECGEDYVQLVRHYVAPLARPGDILATGEKVISMCQNNTVEKDAIRVGFWARFLSRFATHNHNGIGMDEPYKLQLAINLKGLPRILFACFCGAVCRLFGKRGVFYTVAGHDVAGIDGLYSHSAFERYHSLAVLNPRDPDGVCAAIEEAAGLPCMIVDANDLNIEIMGRSPALADKPVDFLTALIHDNPAGQDDECTPFILIHDLGDEEAEPFEPLKIIDGPPAE